MRFTYACQAYEGTVVTAERAAAPIDKGRPGPELLAQVVTAKYADHLPLNRQTEIFARHGVTLARQTFGDWVAAAAYLLTPLRRGARGQGKAGVRAKDSASVPDWTT